VLVLDDLQWADSGTALLLSHVWQDAEPIRLLVLATMRVPGDSACEELLALLARLRGGDAFLRVSLGGLDDAGTVGLVDVVRRQTVSPPFARRLRERTQGNPLFIIETVRSLADAASGGEGSFESQLERLPVPEGIKEVIGRRLARLSETANRALAVASVVGREFRLAVLEALVDAPAEAVLEALEEASAAGLVREVEGDVDRFAFSHPLVREALYEQQSSSRRVRLHYGIAEALERLDVGAEAAELAHHFLESRHLDRAGKAVDYGVRAAETATAALAYEEAVGHYRSVVKAMARRPAFDARRRADILLGLGNAQLRAGYAAADETFASAAAIARAERLPTQLAHAALGMAGRYAQGSAIDAAAIALLEEALAALGERDDPLVVKILAALAINLHYQAEEDRTELLSRQALEAARRIGDPEALVLALQSRHTALFHVSHLQERLQLSEELVALAQRDGERELEALGRYSRIYNLIEAGDMDAARREHDLLSDLAAQLRQPLYQHFAAVWSVVLSAGDRRAAVAEFERVVRDDFAAVRKDQMWLSVVCLLAEACAQIGDSTRAATLYAMLVPYRALNMQIGWVSCFGSVERYLGLLARAGSDWDPAVAHFEAAMADNTARGLHDAAAISRAECADVLLARRAPGDQERALVLLRDTVAAAEAAEMTCLAERSLRRIAAIVPAGERGS
jgi:hypothetical protein